MKNSQKPKRKRAIPYIFGSNRLDELLWQLLDDTDERLRMYVYRMAGTQKLVPAIYVGPTFADLCEWLRDKHGGGDFQVIIRRGKAMELSGIACIGIPLAHCKR